MNTFKKSLCLFSILFLTACGGSSSDDDANPQVLEGGLKTPGSSARNFDSVIETISATPAACPDGGVTVQLGIDTNGNGRLDPDEIDHSRTVTICHGASNHTLFTVADASVSQCSQGGKRLSLGWDNNLDGKLSASEVTEEHILCNGDADYLPGALINTVMEPAGEHCPAGGILVESGIDTNKDGVLALDEIKNSQYICNGVDGTPAETINLTSLRITSKLESSASICNGPARVFELFQDLNSNGSIDEGEQLSSEVVCLETAQLISIVDAVDSTCPAGGKTIASGRDTNADGALQDTEWQQSYTLCSGGSEQVVLPVPRIKIDKEVSGSNCLTGGLKIGTGEDLNANGLLDSNEVTDSYYVCNGTNGQPSFGTTNPEDPGSETGGANTTELLGKLLVRQDWIENEGPCTGYGEKFLIGLDRNDNQQLDDTEVTSVSYSCHNYDSPPTFHNNTVRDGVIGEWWSATVYVNNESSNDIQLTLSEKPSWVSIISQVNNTLVLGGSPTQEGTQSITVSASSGVHTATHTLSFNVIDAVVVSVEGELSEDSSVPSSFEFVLPQALSEPVEVQYSLSYTGMGDNYYYNNNQRYSVLIPAGVTRKAIPFSVSDDTEFSLYRSLQIRVKAFNYTGTENLVQSASTALPVAENDPLLITASSEQSFNFSCHEYVYDDYYNGMGYSCGPVKLDVLDKPEWMDISLQGDSVIVQTVAPTTAVDTDGFFSIRLTFADNTTRTIVATYKVNEIDSDGDGVPDSLDAFPYDARYQTDSDGDGIADEWELLYFDDLNQITATSDFDGDGVSDLSAFLNDTPLKHIRFDFEAGLLPEGWVNTTSTALWSVTSDKAYSGSYSLTAGGDGDYSQGFPRVSFMLNLMDSEVSARVYYEKPKDINQNFYVLYTLTPINGQGEHQQFVFQPPQYDYQNSPLLISGYDQWQVVTSSVRAGRYQVTVELQPNYYDYYASPLTNIPKVYVDFVTGIHGLTKDNFNGIPTLEDRDGDGVPDVYDAFPDDPRYSRDEDGDGLPDEWEELHFGNIWQTNGDGDYDGDGVSDRDEFLNGTHPKQTNLRTVIDILQTGPGQTLVLTPEQNDVYAGTIRLISIDTPLEGTLQQVDEEYRYTPPTDYIGWINLSYTVEDDYSSAEGQILIRVKDKRVPLLSRIDGGYGGYSAALFDDGSLYMWGSNANGQLGTGNTSNSNVPLLIMQDVVEFAVGKGVNNMTLALRTNGSVWAWGNDTADPHQVNLPAEVEVIQIVSSNSYVWLLAKDGSVWRAYSYSRPLQPEQDQSLSSVTKLAVGNSHALALLTDGTVMSYGDNSYGQLGIGTFVSTGESWHPVSKLSNIVKIVAGSDQSFAIDQQGYLYGWGSNNNRKLGDGTGVDRNVPVFVATDIVDVATGSDHTLQLTTEDEVYGVGYNYSGSLGGCVGYSTSNCLLATNASRIGASSSSSFIQRDGVTYAMGRNSSGELGIGTTEDTNKLSPIAWLQEVYLSELGKEGFELGQLLPNWRNGGNYWQVTQDQVYAGEYAIKVASTVADNSSATLGMSIETGEGNVRFRVKTSTEANYDELVFLIDAIEKARFSGETGWVSSGDFHVDAGQHTFEWRYQKDGGSTAGEDTVWLDDIEIPVDTDGDGILDTEDPEPNRVNVTP